MQTPNVKTKRKMKRYELSDYFLSLTTGEQIALLTKQVLPLCDDQTMLVLLGNLYREKRGEEWLHLQESEHSGITYDLYDIGIIFFDKKVYKQHYRMNF